MAQIDSDRYKRLSLSFKYNDDNGLFYDNTNGDVVLFRAGDEQKRWTGSGETPDEPFTAIEVTGDITVGGNVELGDGDVNTTGDLGGGTATITGAATAGSIDVGDAGTTLQTDKVSLSNDDIKNLAGTQKTLVSAAGANTLIEFVRARFVLTAGSEVLTESDDNMAIKYTDDSGAAVSETVEATGFIDSAADTSIDVQPATSAAVANSAAVNKPLVLDNTGTGEYAGNASDDATMDVYITYRVHDLS